MTKIHDKIREALKCHAGKIAKETGRQHMIADAEKEIDVLSDHEAHALYFSLMLKSSDDLD